VTEIGRHNIIDNRNEMC